MVPISVKQKIWMAYGIHAREIETRLCFIGVKKR